MKDCIYEAIKEIEEKGIKSKKENYKSVREQIDKNIEEVKILVSYGATDVDIATYYKINKQTFLVYKKKNKELAEAIEDIRVGNKLISSNILRLLFRLAEGYKETLKYEQMYKGDIVNLSREVYVAPNTKALEMLARYLETGSISVKDNTGINEEIIKKKIKDINESLEYDKEEKEVKLDDLIKEMEDDKNE